MHRCTILKMVSTFRETILIPIRTVPIRTVSGFPEIVDFTHGDQRLLPGYYYVLRSDVHVGPDAEYLEVKERPEELA